MAWLWLLARGISSLFDYCLIPFYLLSSRLLLPVASKILVSWPKLISQYCRLTLFAIILRKKPQRSQIREAPAYIDRLPTEVIEMIIREYSTVSAGVSTDSHANFSLVRRLWNAIFQSRWCRQQLIRSDRLDTSNSLLNLSLVCRRWHAIGQNRWCRQHLFRSVLMDVSGHDEMQRFFILYRRHMIPLWITSLTVNLAPKYPDERFRCRHELQAIMSQVQQDLNALRSILYEDFEMPPDLSVHDIWRALSLHHFSLYVNLSGITAKKKMIQNWTKHWVSGINKQWRERAHKGWKGRSGFDGKGFYSYWDR